MNKINKFFMLAIVVLPVVNACKSNTSKFYMLTPIQDYESTKIGFIEDDMAIGLGPINIPEYLNRPQIVTKNSNNELILSEYNRWSEPLENNVSRVVSENLSNLLGTENIVIFPWSRKVPVNFQIAIQIKKLSSVPGNQIHFEALWSIISVDDERELLRKRFKTTKSIDSENYDHIVNVKSEVLAELSQELATSIINISNSNNLTKLDARHD